MVIIMLKIRTRAIFIVVLSMDILKKATLYQELFWYAWSQNPDDKSLVLRYIFRLQNKINVTRLRKALTYYVQSIHTDCNYNFYVKDGSVYQKPLQTTQEVLTVVDLSKQGINYQTYLETNFKAAFNLTDAPLYKFILLKIKDNEYIFGFAFSHIIFDGSSYQKFSEILQALYNNTSNQWKERNFLKAPEIPAINSSDVKFWKNKIENKSFYQKLDFVKPGANNFAQNTFIKRNFVFSVKRTQKITSILTEANVTIFEFIAGTMSSLIGKYNCYKKEEDIVLGYSLSVDRSKSAIGCYTNFNPLNIKFLETRTPRDIVLNIHNCRDEIRPHQHVPIGEIATYVSTPQLPNLSLNVFINNSPGLIGINPFQLNNVECELLESPCTDGSYDIGIIYSLVNDKLHIQLSCKKTLFNEDQAAEIINNYREIVEFFCKNIDSPLSNFDLIPIKDKISGPKIKLKQNYSLKNIFHASFKKNTDKLALIYNAQSWTYAQLENEIKKVLYLLDNKINIKNDNHYITIGIHLERSHNIVIAVLCSIFRDFCFVPLDPSYPLEYLTYIVDSSKIDYIVTDKSALNVSKLKESCKKSLEFICIDALENIELNDYELIKFSNVTHNLPQYILYTSGSTGSPKGVIILQKNLLNFILAMQQLKLCNESDYFLAVTSLNFDISLLEILLPLSMGAIVDIGSRDITTDSIELAKRIESEPVTIIQATPSTWRMLQSAGWKSSKQLKILTGGENIDKNLADFLLAQHHKIYNMYGPTETTIWSSSTEIINTSEISIGMPIANTDLYIYDSNHNQLPMGIPGELWIGGEGIGHGYINVANKDSNFVIKDRKTFYKTGDIVCYYGNGYLKFIGRNDSQVKVRGHRVDLNEITKFIKEIIDCYEVITVLRILPEQHLISFIQPKSKSINTNNIMKFLAMKLPNYMVPQRIVVMKNFPLTANRKIDQKTLQNTNIEELIKNYGVENIEALGEISSLQTSQSEENSIRVTLLTILNEQFGIVVKEGYYDYVWGFFGFNSLSFNRLAKLINESFKANIHPHHFYIHNTINKLSDNLNQQNEPIVYKPHLLNKALNDSRASEIAIIGISGQLPKANSLNTFWSNLLAAQSAISYSDRLTIAQDFKAGFLNGIENFDANFFSISPLEANVMDPRQRLLLQESWRALEDAGYSPKKLEQSNVGVYIAATGHDYYSIQNKINNFISIPYSLPGIADSILSNRISYFFNFNGPSQTIDTACSGSLVALVRACHDLEFGLIDYALVASANIILDSEINNALKAGNFLSPQYRCATFDESADGYVRGEGVGCVLLKRANDAEKDGDHSYGIIVSSAENHGGRAHSLTAPNPEAQKALLLAAYKDRDLARQVSYIEAHGTGTKLGDPIEIDALKMAWKELGLFDNKSSIGLGSVKTNIGHLEPAAGIASLLKVLLCLKHNTLPANLHFNKLNPYIDIKDSPFYIVNGNKTWDSQGPRVAGISSFGFGGSNAHVVIMEPKERELRHSADKPAYLICISAKNQWSLKQLQKDLVEQLANIINKNEKEYSLANIAYTLNIGRNHFEYRTAWVVSSIDELVNQLKQNELTKVQEVSIKGPVEEAVVPWTEKERYIEQLNRWRELYLQGYEINWDDLHSDESKLRLSLPIYPFHTQPYWFENAADSVMIKEVV
jgi:amino acid adenylation domain-containing protein